MVANYIVENIEDIKVNELILSDAVDYITYKGKKYALKDLEVLELIKKHKRLTLYGIFEQNNSYCGQSNVETEKRKKDIEEIKRIKEWLENGTK